MNKEVWKNIEGYENLYQISNYGRVKSIPRNTTKGKILKLGYNNDGYNQVCLYDGKGNKKTYRVCRLVGIHFLNNPNNYPEINHIDKNVKNDYYENLEWCDRKYNVNYSKSKKVKSIDDEGNETFYNSIYETRLFGFNYGNVYRCCKNGQKHKNLRWEYVK